MQEIQKLKNIQNILKTKLSSNYTNKTEQKNNHFVYDDGNNQNRIFYFEVDKKFYIYKVFENHDRYEEYLNKNSFSKDFKQQFATNSQIYKLKMIILDILFVKIITTQTTCRLAGYCAKFYENKL